MLGIKSPEDMGLPVVSHHPFVPIHHTGRSRLRPEQDRIVRDRPGGPGIDGDSVGTINRIIITRQPFTIAFAKEAKAVGDARSI